MKIQKIELDKCRNLWTWVFAKESSKVPFLTYDWHTLWFRIFGQEYTPYYLSAAEELIAPFARRGNELIFSGGIEFADYLDIVGNDGVKEDGWQHLLDFIKHDNVTKMTLQNVPESSSTVAFFKALRTTPRIKLMREDVTPLLSLPDNWDTYLQLLNHKDRHELRRKIKRFEQLFSSIKIVHQQHHLADMELLLTLMRLNPDKKIFLNSQMEHFFRETTKIFSDYVLFSKIEIDDTTAATTFSFRMNNKFLLYNSGFDRNAFPGAGFYLKAQTVKYAIEQGLSEYNFLQGNERYKYELGGKDFFVYSIEIFL